jgi:hypothetical protein
LLSRKEQEMAGTAASSSSRTRCFAKTLAGIGLIWLVACARRKPRASAKHENHAAAFRDRETDVENFDQTRSAGPDAMRDRTRRRWDSVDQASDESFPASDPPSTY